MPSERSERVLTTGQVARICKVAPRTVAKWFDSGDLRGYRIPGSKDRRIPMKHLIRFMQTYGMPLEELETGQTRVLIVDDEHEFTTLLRDALNAQGQHAVDIAATMFEAGVLTQKNHPHVIVADVSLPGMHAKKLSQFLRSSEDFEHVRLIAVGGGLTPGQGMNHVQNGFDAYLPKPFDVRQLVTGIDAVLSRTD